MNRNLRAVLVGTGMGAAAFASAMLVRNRTLASNGVSPSIGWMKRFTASSMPSRSTTSRLWA